MNIPHPTRPLRAAQAVLGAHAARQRTQFVRIMASQLNQIAPGTVRVRTVPITHDGRRRTWVVLDATTGPISAAREQHRAAFGLLSRAFPEADWTRPRTYDARTGVLAVDQLAAPAELGLDTAEVTR